MAKEKVKVPIVDVEKVKNIVCQFGAIIDEHVSNVFEAQIIAAAFTDHINRIRVDGLIDDKLKAEKKNE